MIHFIENPKLRMDLGNRGRNHIHKNYNLNTQLRNLENIYSEIDSAS